MPVLAGAGGYDTREVIELARDMERVGADGLLSVTPYYNKPTQEGLYQHFKAIAESTPLPIVLYNVPGAHRRQHVDVETTLRLSEIPQHRRRSRKPRRTSCRCPRSSPPRATDFHLLSGDDPITVAVMAIGGRGVVSVASNEAPAEMAQIVELCEKGDFAGARKLHHWLLPLIQVNFVETEPDPVQGGDGGDGADRRELSPAAGAAEPRRRATRSCSVLQQLKLLGAAARVVGCPASSRPSESGSRRPGRSAARAA